MAWDPNHFDAEGLTADGPFPRDDLAGGEGYLSVDRSDRHLPAVGQLRARQQRRKALEKQREAGQGPPHGALPERFREALNLHLPCREVRDHMDEGCHPFAVTPAPEEDDPENPAHCALRNVSGQKGRAYINKLRQALRRIAVRSGSHVLLEPESLEETAAALEREAEERKRLADRALEGGTL